MAPRPHLERAARLGPLTAEGEGGNIDQAKDQVTSSSSSSSPSSSPPSFSPPPLLGIFLQPEEMRNFERKYYEQFNLFLQSQTPFLSWAIL